MIKAHDAGTLNTMAKKIAPQISRAVMRSQMSGILPLLETYAAIIQGKGAGTGWDMEGEIQSVVSLIKRSAANVFDVGANKGVWSRAILAHLGDQAHIYQFEPSSYCQDVLRNRDLPRTTLIAAAVGAAPGHATLYSPKPGSGIASLHPRRDSYFRNEEFEGERVEVVTIDDVIDEIDIDYVDFMKMDLEGHELAALTGARRALETNKIKALSFEFGSAHINSRIFFHDFWDFFSDFESKIKRICPGGQSISVNEYYEDLEYFRGVSNYIVTFE